MGNKSTDDAEHLDLAEAAADELTKMHGGKPHYMAWLKEKAPLMYTGMQGIGCEIFNRGSLFPLPVFQTYIGLWVAMHRHAFTMWEHRDELNLLTLPVPNSRAM